MKILIVSSAIPFPPLGGGQLRTFHLAKALAHEHQVTLVGFTFETPIDEDTQAVAGPIRVIDVEWQSPALYQQMVDADERVADRAAEILADERHEPWFVSFYESPQMERALRLLAREDFDLTLFEGTDMARFMPCLPRECPKVVDFMDLHSLMAIRASERAVGELGGRSQTEATRTLRFEKEIARQAVLCLICSETEAAAARTLLDVDRIAIIPNGVDTFCFKPADRPQPGPVNVVFTGTMNYAPNVEAVRYLARDIWPSVHDALPAATLHIVGANPGDEVKSLACDHIVVHGRVPDMRPHLSQATVVVAPLLSGGGTRLKILEAAACGKAIVSTSFGAEGLKFCAPRDLILADSPCEFADAVIRLACDEASRRQLECNARRASLAYDWRGIGERLRRTVGSLALNRVNADVCRSK